MTLGSPAYLVDLVRTPVTRRRGSLADIHPIDLGGHVIRQLLARHPTLDPAAVDDVIFGCVDSIGPQSSNIARNAWLASGGEYAVPGVTVDRQCGSSQQAVHFAASEIVSGNADVIVAGGVQNMSMVPISASSQVGLPSNEETPFAGSDMWEARFGSQEFSQFLAADRIAERWGLDRAELEHFALRSHERAAHALATGRFVREIVPLAGVSVDEGPRTDTTLDTMAALQTVRQGGRTTAATSSQIADGASAVLVTSEEALARFNLVPRARVHTRYVGGDDPVDMLTAPISATRAALARSDLSPDQIDVVEINEAFASVVLAWISELGFDPDRVNPNGGAIALGHPIGATGTKLMTTLVNELESRGARFGLQVMCEGGGLANVTIVERCS